jgi:hypothetical protein
MNQAPYEITIEVGSDDPDPKELQRITRQLRDQIRELDSVSVHHGKDGPGDGDSKGDPVTLVSLVVTLAPVVLPKLIDLVTEMIKRGHDRKVKISITLGDRSAAIELSGSVTPEQTDSLILKATAAVAGR